MATPIKCGNEFIVNGITANDQRESAVTALADGRFVVMWTDDSHTLGDASRAVHGQIFHADGSKAGLEFRANTDTAEDQLEATIMPLPNGGFLAVWASFVSFLEADLRAQVFNPDRSKAGAEFSIA